jgi:hypothetical protein
MVVEHEDERARLREPLEQRTHGAMTVVALVLEARPSRARELRQRREDLGKPRSHVLGEG